MDGLNLVLRVAWGRGGRKRRLTFFVLMLPHFGNSFFFFFFILTHSTVKVLVCALCNTAVLATSAGQRFCNSESSNRVCVAFVTKK